VILFFLSKKLEYNLASEQDIIVIKLLLHVLVLYAITLNVTWNTPQYTSCCIFPVFESRIQAIFTDLYWVCIEMFIKEPCREPLGDAST